MYIETWAEYETFVLRRTLEKKINSNWSPCWTYQLQIFLGYRIFFSRTRTQTQNIPNSASLFIPATASVAIQLGTYFVHNVDSDLTCVA